MGMGVYDNKTGTYGAVVVAHLLGGDPLLNGVCNPTFMAQNSVTTTTLVQLSMNTAPMLNDNGATVFHTDASGCYQPIGTMTGFLWNAPTTVYMNDAINGINALNGNDSNMTARTANGAVSPGQFNWQPWGGTCGSSGAVTAAADMTAAADDDDIPPERKLYRQLVYGEKAKVDPHIDELLGLSGLDTQGRPTYIVSMSPRLDADGSVSWYIGAMGKCGGVVPGTALQQEVVEHMRKYTTARVYFEEGQVVFPYPVPGCSK